MAKINGARADEHTRKMFNTLESKTEKDDKKNNPKHRAATTTINWHGTENEYNQSHNILLK